MLPESEIFIRFAAATVIGLIIGFTRRHKPAGMRTFALIILGCTMFTVISIEFSPPGSDSFSRILAQIISGIGFLGLGVIWKQGIAQPSGITTAAGIWVAAAIGIMIGLAMWPEAIIGTIMAIFVMFSKHALQEMHME
ncbi:MgtC/SapB family protein [Candidatus Micrarchaeota archaeon]|nr:MgtC/SapB family protein [Candidatus Micrarchaeota archaeon]